MNARARAIAAAVAGLPACLAAPFDDPFPMADDVALPLPPTSSAELAVQASMAAIRTNLAVAGTLEAIAPVVEVLEGRRETRRDGSVRIYGPFEDPDDEGATWVGRFDDGEPIAWALAAGGEDADEDDTSAVLAGEISERAATREGSFTIDFDALASIPGARFGDAGMRRGLAEVAFERTDMLAEVGIAWHRFADGGDPAWADQRFESRAVSGDTTLHVALVGTFAGTVLARPSATRLVIDLRWLPDGSGRARGTFGHGELVELVVHECFDATGALVWRETEPAGAIPGIGLEACSVSEGQLDGLP